MNNQLKSFILILGILITFQAKCQLWRTLGDYNYVWIERCTLLGKVGDSLLISGGIMQIDDFNNVGSFFWDSLDVNATQWAMNFESIAEFDNKHFFGGFFEDWQGPDNSFSFEASGVVAWDGTTWFDEDGVDSGFCQAELEFMQVYNGKLYAGNNPNSLGEYNNFDQIAAYEGAQWTDNGGVTGGFGLAECTAVYNGELYVAGGFEQTTNPVQVARGIARFDGNQWHPVGNGLYGNVHAMCVDMVTNRLYVGGYFVEVDGNVSNIAWWDGTDFHPMDNPWLEVEAMCMYRNQLYVAGNQYAFDDDGNAIQTTENFYRWDGYAWHLVADVILEGSQSGVGGIGEMIVYKDELYVGGTFNMIGSLETQNVARYFLHPDSVQWGVPDIEASLEKEDAAATVVDEFQQQHLCFYPNPAQDFVFLALEFEPELSTEFILLDDTGREVLRTTVSLKNERIELFGLKPGHYNGIILNTGSRIHVGELVVR